MKYIETHCHLDYLKAFPIEEILRKSKEAGLEKIITISVEPDNLDAVIEIANQYDDVYTTQGVHPHDASKITPEDLIKIKSQAKAHKKVLAIGEIGLDYHYNNSPQEVQRKMFEAQLTIAEELDLPVVIHTRDADEDTLSILKNHSKYLKRKGVIHSFTSGKVLAEYAISEGYKIGFNGIISFPKAENVREILELTPVENILLETDSPFLTPVPHRGKENGPYFLPFVAIKMAQVKKIDLNQMADIIYKNSLELFDF